VEGARDRVGARDRLGTEEGIEEGINMRSKVKRT
jgi:hypothetical protein